MKESFNSEKISYSGRIAFKEDGAYFYYASSYAEISFTGTEISVTLNNSSFWGTVYLGYVIDGRMGKIPLPRENDGRDAEYKLADCLEPGIEHTALIYKSQSANHLFSLKSITVDGEVLMPPEKTGLKLEFYGDSVSAGEVTEAYDFTGRADPASHNSIYDNSYLSYTWITARNLNARFHNVSQGGIAVFDGTGYFHYPDMIGMESVYDKLCYFPEGGELTSWDFSRFTPDIVVFALGQNDKHNGVTDKDDIDITDPSTRSRWKEGYKSILKNIRARYGENTKYIFITTVLMHDPEWDRAIDEAVRELQSENIKAYHFLFKRNGAATPGHPRYAEQKEMAAELTEFIRSIL